MNSMGNKMSSDPQEPKISLWKNAILGLIIGIALAILGCVIISGITIWSGTRMPKHLEIDSSEVPIYANAQNISQEGPIIEDATEVYSWSFSSTDAPDVVWQFCLEEMSQRWGFNDVSSPQSLEKSLIVQSCPFYYLEMTSTPIDSTTYNYVVQFSKELCR
jgi:hypothetical protein